ncbi:hypothetical protein JTB14_006014 [Gonioctena quinquepunctata]|nr:hypothetical protein JTB14_006014 [Gonioctena quinquepunctata]
MKGLKNAGKEFDPQYGVRIDPTTEKTYIGNVEIRFTDKEISLWDDNARIATFNGGPELYELIFLRLPQAALNSRIKTEDLQSYKKILIDSKAAYKDYNPRKGLKNNSTRKFVEIITPLLNEEKGNTSNIISTPKLNKNTKRSKRGTGYMQELVICRNCQQRKKTFDDKISEVRYTLSRKYDILAERMTDSEQKVSDPRSKDRPVLAVPPSWEPTHEIEI